MNEVPHTPASSCPGHVSSSPSSTGGAGKRWPQQQTHHTSPGPDVLMNPGSRAEVTSDQGVSGLPWSADETLVLSGCEDAAGSLPVRPGWRSARCATCRPGGSRG